MFKLRFSTLMLRWYFMMLVGILAVYSGQSWLIFGMMFVAVSAVLGYRVGGPPRKQAGRIVRLEGEGAGEQRRAS